MAFEREAFLKVLEDSYTAYYNIIKEGLPEDLPLAFRADYFQRGERYWISKKIPIWGNETNEYCYVFSNDSFDEALVTKCTDFALDDGLPRVQPHKEHQFTNVKCIFIADSFTDDAIKIIKRRNFQKSYNHSLWGYSNLLSTGVSLGNEKVYVNRAADDMKKYFKKLFSAQKKKSKAS